MSELPPGETRLDAFRENMKSERESQEISQAELARRMSAVGYNFHQQTVQKIESGTRPVRLDEAADISRELGHDLNDMLSTPETLKQIKLHQEMYDAALEAGTALSDAVEALARYYERQKAFARAADRRGTDWRGQQEELLEGTLQTVQEQFELRLDFSKHALSSARRLSSQERANILDYHGITVVDTGRLGPNMQRFVNAHPELRRRAKLDESAS
ncbi:hypothetical protein GCM10027060_18930 [Nesterenkonia halophila]|uniref:helix-turn-helix domain-containing protein n=1 Tax=Nesterenkonia halophila TaxID=302044 RepID=UPI001292737E|nr:helix-turn-helix transcriptional regulator [Nesterenkonia halophila]